MKNSIKKAQSQACLGFAERKNFRPLAKLKKLSLTLLLLITAVGGAWAEDSESITTTLPEAKTGSVEFTGTHFKITGQRADGDGMTLGSSTNYTITISALNGEIITKVEMTIGFKFYSWQGDVLSTKGNVSGQYTTGYNLTLTDVDVSEVTLSASNTTGFLLFNKFKIFYTMPAGTMTLNTDNTVATMTMPANDVTVNYTLVRDMQDEANPVAFSGLPTNDEPIVVKKGDDGKYQPAETLNLQLIDPLAAAEAQNIIAADGITIKVLVGNGGTPIEFDQEPPITLEAFLADMKPGYYWIKAESTDENSPYDGTVYSSQFTVVEKYDLTVKPANDFSKNGLDAVTVGSESVTIDANTGEATKTGIAPDTEVKIKAKRGYVIEKVEAKKGAATSTQLSAATTDDIGKVVCAVGHLHDAKTAVPDGCTAVGILGSVTSTGHGLILALKDATEQNWNTINGWTSASYAGTTLKVLPDDAARGNLTSYTTLGGTAVSDWAVAQYSDYEAIFTNLGSTMGDDNGKTYDDHVEAYITTGVDGAEISGAHWSATEVSDIKAFVFYPYYYWYPDEKTSGYKVRPVLGF